MKNTCVPQKISKLMFVGLILAAALGMTVIGVTLLPIFGIVMAMPILALGIYIYRLRFNDQCELEP